LTGGTGAAHLSAMRNSHRLLLAAVLLPAIVTAQAPAPARRAPVIVLGFDGFARRYLDEDSAPAFRALAREGVTAEAMIPSFPSFTFPNWYAMATGLYPAHSGIVNNIFYDPAFDTVFIFTKPIAREGRWWGGDPIWNTAVRQGKRSATMFWVGSDAPVGGHLPTYWQAFDAKVPFHARVAQVLAWLDLPDSTRPDLIMAYFQEPDHTGHENGPDSPEVRAAVLGVDSALATLVAGLRARGLYDRANLVIVADHGMAATGPERVVYLDDVVDSSSVRVVYLTPLLLIEPKDGDRAALLGKLRSLPHVSAWLRDSVPARLHYSGNPRITSIVGVADDGWTIAWRHGKAVKPGGAHGYDNQLRSMQAIFIAHGGAFKGGTTLPPFENVNIYALLAHLLGVNPSPSDGSLAPFESILK